MSFNPAQPHSSRKSAPRPSYHSSENHYKMKNTQKETNFQKPHNIGKNHGTNISHDNKDCCKPISISLGLTEPDSQFFEELKKVYNMVKRSPPAVALLEKHFASCNNPYIQTLRLLYNCQDFFNAKNKSLPVFIAEEFRTFSKKYKQNILHLLVPSIQLDAFKVITKQNVQSLTKIIFEVYDLEENSGLFLDIVRCLVENKHFKEACQYATMLKLHTFFSVEDFLVPLILQDRLYSVDDFLIESPKHQVDLVAFLDNALSEVSIAETMRPYIDYKNIPEVKFDKVHSKPWKKTIARFVKMFKLSPDLTPNLNKKRNEGALRFLVHKRFTENTFGDESWKEMVQEAIGDEEVLKKELVFMIAQYGDYPEALRWAKFYGLNRDDWPYNIRMLDENSSSLSPQANQTDNWDDISSSTNQAVKVTDAYHKLSLPANSIVVVDSPDKFRRFLDESLHDVYIVGVDCEWKPSFGSQTNELALMQISTRHSCFIFDIISLSKFECPHLWQEIGKFLFNNCDIIKLGFSLTSDIHMVRQAIPELNFTTTRVSFLDLCALWKQLEKFPGVKLPYEVQSGSFSLSALVESCLGRPLDKSEQFSNWEKRPLRHTQINYAALDAYCLIEVYDIIKQCCEGTDCNFEELCYAICNHVPVLKKKTKKTHNSHNRKARKENTEVVQPPSPHTKPIQAHELKVVCDSMLQGLGKNLRRCGIDAAILENHEDHHECVKYALNDGRYILTRKGPFKNLSGSVPQGHCLNIISDDVDKQLNEVLNYYKVTVTKEHVFSRCQACNSNQFVKVPQATMVALYDNIYKGSYSNSLKSTPAGYYDDFEDEHTGFTSEEDDYQDDYLGPASTSTNHERTPLGDSSSRKWDLTNDKIDIANCETKLGVTIKLDQLPKQVVDRYQEFFICESCGKVYYDGTHFDKVINGRLQGIVQ